MKNRLKFFIEEDQVGKRLDRVLGEQSEVRSRTRAEKLFHLNLVFLNSNLAKASSRLKPGDCVEYEIPVEVSPSDLIHLDTKLDILFEDSDLIVLNKPAGLVMHPAAGHAQDTLVNALLNHTTELSMGFHEQRPGIVHRLDRDTSGVLVVAKNDEAHAVLADQFRARTVHRIYQCLVQPTRIANTALIESYLARHPVHRKKFSSVRDGRGKIGRAVVEHPRGKWAITNYKILQTIPGKAHLLEVKLGTGRTHQIRVHLAEWGAPLLGDPIYGTKNLTHVPRLALHARELGFTHPRTREKLFFYVPWPDVFRDLFLDWDIRE